MGLFDNILGTSDTTNPTGSSQGDSTAGSTADSTGGGTTQDDTNTVTPQIIPEMGVSTELDIGGNMADLFPTENPTVVVTSEEAIVSETPMIDIAPETPMIELGTEVSINSEVLDASPAILAESISSEVSPVQPKEVMLDDKIASFLKELEQLRANDDMLLHEKEVAIQKIEEEMKVTIEKLESEKKDLEKEVKKIQADEKKIDSTIASLNGTTKSK